MALTISAIVCAYNEVAYLSSCLFSLRAQTRVPDKVIVVDNASSDATADVAQGVPGVRVLHEPTKGLVVARRTARGAARGDVLAYVDVECRAPLQWLERVERRFTDGVVAHRISRRGHQPRLPADAARNRRLACGPLGLDVGAPLR